MCLAEFYPTCLHFVTVQIWIFAIRRFVCVHVCLAYRLYIKDGCGSEDYCTLFFFRRGHIWTSLVFSLLLGFKL